MGCPHVSQALTRRIHQVTIISTSPPYLPYLFFTSMHPSATPTEASSSTRVHHATSSPNASSSQSSNHPLLHHILSLWSSPTKDPSHANTLRTMHKLPLTRSLSITLSTVFLKMLGKRCLASHGSTKCNPIIDWSTNSMLIMILSLENFLVGGPINKRCYESFNLYFISYKQMMKCL